MPEITNEELDRRTAVEIMGWEHKYSSDSNIGYYIGKQPHMFVSVTDWHPSTDLNQAWQVAEQIAKDNEISIFISFDHTDNLMVEIDGDWYECIKGEPIARAICLAALQAGGK
mgnify:CR=1 FL=1